MIFKILDIKDSMVELEDVVDKIKLYFHEEALKGNFNLVIGSTIEMTSHMIEVNKVKSLVEDLSDDFEEFTDI